MNTRATRTMLGVSCTGLLLTMPTLGLGYPTFVPDNQPVGWVAQATMTSFDLRSTGQIAYSPSYLRSNWSGDLNAYPVSTSGVVNSAGQLWNSGAAGMIGLQNYDTGRRIVTLKDDGSRIAFRWANLSAAQQGTIGTATDGPLILNYVRGDRSNEAPNGLLYRKRGGVLGDILHSRPVYVTGANPMVYVGANDGMLHAINARDGTEAYGYVPSMLIVKLNKLAPLATSGYTHQHYVDASPNAATVLIGGNPKTLLAGGLGAGGKGIYALDITSDLTAAPTSESAATSRILWEITPTRISGTPSASYANLGYTYGVPVIGKANSGSGQAAMFMPNGYLGASGTAILYVIDASNGSLIRAIDTASGTAAAPNGLSAITAIDTNADGRIDYVYGGDLDGNMWRFDVRATSAASWSVSKLYTTSPAQPIIIPPAVSPHPAGGYMVDFATGALFTAADTTALTTYYAYGIRDGGSGTALMTQTLTAKTWSDPGYTGTQPVRTATDATPDWGTQLGWKVALPAGERVVGDTSFIENARFYFTSTNPAVNLSGNPPGENWLHELNYLNGGVGTIKPFFDFNDDLLLDDRDLIKDAAGSPVAGATGISIAKKLPGGVISQPLLIQLQTLNTSLFEQNPDTAAPPIPDGGAGVSNGHFDSDIYYSTGKTFQSMVHWHEYDDIFNVTGINFLNASSPDLNLANAIPSTTTPFKILIANQYLNPATKVRIGPGATYVPVKTYGSMASSTDPAVVIGAQPTYTRADIGNFIFNLPLDAFASKDWWGDGKAPRAGLMPTQTSCVNAESFSVSKAPDTKTWDPTPGVQGERHNGALNFIIVKSTTPASALELNVAGKPEYGWRVKITEWNNWVLAEYTAFWHHPNGLCYTPGSGWVQNPPQDPVSGRLTKTPAAGSADPANGDMTNNSSVVSVTTTTVANVSTTTVTYADGSKMTVVTTSNADGTQTVVTTTADGKTTTVTLAPSGLITGADESSLQPRTGRISWREMYR